MRGIKCEVLFDRKNKEKSVYSYYRENRTEKTSVSGETLHAY